jgi:hypothetical protein
MAFVLQGQCHRFSRKESNHETLRFVPAVGLSRLIALLALTTPPLTSRSFGPRFLTKAPLFAIIPINSVDIVGIER